MTKMLILGIGSMFGGVQMITTSIIDHWPHLREHEWRVTAGACVGCFIAALPMTCNGGVYLFTLMDWHTASWAILLIGFAEIVVLSWVYGMSRTLENLKDMGIKFRIVIRIYWKSVWIVATPFVCIVVLIFLLTGIGPTQFRDYVFPVWADVLGWMLGLSTLMPLVVFAITQSVKGKYSFKDLLKPSEHWGPQEIDGQRIDRTKLN